jgi:hypothetical protein
MDERLIMMGNKDKFVATVPPDPLKPFDGPSLGKARAEELWIYKGGDDNQDNQY